jgi:hypothetical protein
MQWMEIFGYLGEFGFYFLQLAAERLTRDAQQPAAQPA